MTTGWTPGQRTGPGRDKLVSLKLPAMVVPVIVHPVNSSWTLLALILCGSTGFAEVLTLPEAIDQALVHNRRILQADLLVEEALIVADSAAAAFTPRLGPEFGTLTSGENDFQYAGLQARKRFVSGAEADAAGGMEFRDGDDGAYLRFSLSQPLFRNAGSLVQREPEVAALERVAEARRNGYLRREDVVLEVVRGYESVLRYQRQVELDTESVRRLGRLTILTRAREENGEGSRIDTLRMELQEGEAQTRFENNRELLQLEQDDFLNLLGLPGATSLTLHPPPLLDLELPPLDEAVQVALSNRLDIAQALQQVSTADRQVRLARRNLQPDLRAFGTYRLIGGQQGRDEFALEEERWSAGFSLAPDLDRYERRANLLSTLTQRDLQSLAVADLERWVEIDVKQQVRAYHRAMANHQIAVRNTDLARKRLELAEVMYQMGSVDNFHVSDAETAFAESSSAELAARAEASLAGYRALKSLGTLVEAPDALRP